VRRRFDYPAAGTELCGEDAGTLSGNIPLYTAFASGQQAPVEYDFKFTLTPTTVEELKLVIEPRKYDAWRPRAELGGKPGEALSVTARLVRADGKAPATKLKKLTWRLVDTSREPGIAMNFPVGATDRELDLRFKPRDDLSHVTAEDGQTMEWLDPSDAHADTVEVEPYDWGGWSTLEVTAELEDGRRVQGMLEGASEAGARLPQRAVDSFISDHWKDVASTSAPDDADDDGDPKGDGTAGDGLTLYQEYRGFYQQGEHMEGDPNGKDFFVLNRMAGAATAGIELFAELSALRVHYQLAESELPASRVINGNLDQGPAVAEQHAVIVEVAPGQHGVARAEGGPGNPRQVRRIAIMGEWATLPSAEFASVVAHELMHSVNVWHHGEADYPVIWQDVNGSLVETGGRRTLAPIVVANEQEVDVTWQVLGRIDQLPGKRERIVLGVDGGQSSGMQHCVMRYNNAETYIDREQPGKRYVFPAEPLGGQLCTSAEGDGVNDSDWSPQSRFSNAREDRGACASQILVTDAVTAPTRY